MRSKACAALGQTGDKAATSELIGILLDVHCMGDDARMVEVYQTMAKILKSFAFLSDLKPDTVWKFSKYVNELNWVSLENVRPEKLIKAFLNTEIPFWCLIIKTIFVRNGYGLTLLENTVTVYDNTEPVELSFSNIEFGQQLQNCLVTEID